MNEIKSAVLIGAGALGLMYMPFLQKVLGDRVCFLAGEDRYDRLAGTVFILNGESRSMPVKRPGELSETPDLILVSVKNHHLEKIAPLLKQTAGKNTIIVSVLNGIDSEEFLEKTCPESTVLYCAVLGMDAVKEGPALTYSGTGKFLIGARNNQMDDAALLSFAAFLDKAGLAYSIPRDIHREIWYKWMINLGINQISAVAGATYGTFQTGKEIHDLMTDAMKETIMVARALKIDLREEDLDRWEGILHSLGPEGKTSMLQDMEAERKTEVESFSGKLITLARGLNLNVPINETLYRLIRTREQLYS